jgi:bis(5'-nucleosyl)-tetraphosphatase (symmetrical)
MRTIFVGDVHGCLDELRELMAKLGLVRSDTLVFVGDLVDRGPDPVGVVRFVREISALEFVTKVNKGNHEEKALRWLRHEDKVAAGKQPKNPMKAVPEGRMAEWRGLNAEDRAFLEALPLVHEFDVGGQPWVSVHGGLLPGRPLADQVRKHASELIRCRWVDAEGKHVGMLEGSREMPHGAFPWMERFDGQYNVVCGHAVHREAEIKAQVQAGAPSPGFPPRVDKTAAGFEVWSIDTGCFGGGRLSALVLDHDRPDAREVVQVQARAAYFDFKGDAEGGV